MKTITTVYLDVNKTRDLRQYDVRQGDKDSREFHIILTENGQPITLTSGMSATADAVVRNVIVAQGEALTVDTANQYIVMTLTEEMLTLAGNMKIDVKVSESGAVLTAATLVLYVGAAVINENTHIEPGGTTIGAQIIALNTRVDAAEAEIADAAADVSALHDAIENLEAIPCSVKLAMDTLFSKAAYADDDAASSYATFHAWAISNPVTFITAVFTQGSATIHDTDSLDTLKQHLTVTATYSDSTTATVTDYTLSGTLTEGTSTITVSYGGKTTTFSVTVTEDDRYSVEYQGNFTTASPSNTRITLITNDVTLSEGETVAFSVPSGYEIFALQSYATGGNSAIDRTAKADNQIYVNCVSSSGYNVPKDTIVYGYNAGVIPFDRTGWTTKVVYTKGSGTATVSGIGFFVQKYVNEEAVELSIAEAKSVVSIAYA